MKPKRADRVSKRGALVSKNWKIKKRLNEDAIQKDFINKLMLKYLPKF